jgi:hypothetical protein
MQDKENENDIKNKIYFNPDFIIFALMLLFIVIKKI